MVNTYRLFLVSFATRTTSKIGCFDTLSPNHPVNCLFIAVISSPLWSSVWGCYGCLTYPQNLSHNQFASSLPSVFHDGGSGGPNGLLGLCAACGILTSFSERPREAAGLFVILLSKWNQTMAICAFESLESWRKNICSSPLLLPTLWDRKLY